MGASQEKKLRRELREKGMDKHQLAEQKALEANKRSHRNKLFAGIAVAVVILVIIVFSSGMLYSNFTALKIGDVNYSAAEYNFFYKTNYNNFVSQYGSYLSMMGLDTTKDLSTQQYTEDQTWADFFKDSAKSTMQEMTALYSEAQKAGYKLDETTQASLDASIASLQTVNSGSDYTSPDAYLAATYGTGCTVEVLSSLFEKYYVYQAYAAEKRASFTYTGDQLKTYYAENKDTLDNFTYISYFVDGSVADTSADASASPAASPAASADTEAAAAAAMAKAKTTADAIVADVATADEFKAAVLAQTQAEASESTTQGSSLSTTYADWLKDASRAQGDTTVIASDTGYYALFFISRDDNNYNTVDVRHILIKAVAADDGTYSDEAKATAKQKAEDLLAEWKAADATQDSFAALANANSEDTGSNTTGGLYENVYKGQMVTEFNDWCFDASRKAGDTGIVYGESSSYTGYHVIYFVGQGVLYCDKLAEDSAREKDYSAWKTALLENFKVSNGFTEFLVK